jgi:hypothetical protein
MRENRLFLIPVAASRRADAVQVAADAEHRNRQELSS